MVTKTDKLVKESYSLNKKSDRKSHTSEKKWQSSEKIHKKGKTSEKRLQTS